MASEARRQQLASRRRGRGLSAHPALLGLALLGLAGYGGYEVVKDVWDWGDRNKPPKGVTHPVKPVHPGLPTHKPPASGTQAPGLVAGSMMAPMKALAAPASRSTASIQI